MKLYASVDLSALDQLLAGHQIDVVALEEADIGARDAEEQVRIVAVLVDDHRLARIEQLAEGSDRYYPHMRPIGPISQDHGQNRGNATDRSHLLYRHGMETISSTTELGAAIRERRRGLRITQDDLAASIGVNRKVVGQLEKGKATVHVEIVLRAAQAVGLNVGVEPRG